jgi:hypothetical protein
MLLPKTSPCPLLRIRRRQCGLKGHFNEKIQPGMQHVTVMESDCIALPIVHHFAAGWASVIVSLLDRFGSLQFYHGFAEFRQFREIGDLPRRRKSSAWRVRFALPSE